MSSSVARYFPGAFGAEPSHKEAEDAQVLSTEVGSAQSPEQPISRSPTASAVDLIPSLTDSSDEALIGRIRDGDKEALACLFRRYARVVRAVSYRVLRDTAEADDLVQDLFLLVHRNCTAFDSSKSPARFWILQMAYRRAISRRRYLTSRHFYTRLDLEDAEDLLADPRTEAGQFESSIDGKFGDGALKRVFDELSEDQRQTLRLFFIEGYTLDEIAAKLGQSRGNVKHHYFRGLDRLRKELFGSKLPGERAL